MTESTADEPRKLDRRYVVFVLAAAALLVAYYFQDALRGTPQRAHTLHLAGLCLLGVAVRPWLSGREWRETLLVISLAGCAIVAGFDCLVMFAFAAAVIGLARARAPLWLRVTAMFALWAAPIVAKLWFERAQIVPHMPLFLYWSCVPFAALYVLVERERGRLQEARWSDEALYLLALPRLMYPFFQAISPSLFLASQTRDRTDPKLAARGLLLGVYGVALFVLMARLPYIPPPRPDVVPNPRFVGVPPFLHNVLFVYASNAAAIFGAVGLFRLLGFDLPSGFRQPFLSRSFPEFYRRWNHYIYDSIKSLFLFPLLGTLRRWLPDRAASVVAGYLAIFLGSFCSSAILVPIALDPNVLGVLSHVFELKRMLILGVFWSGILLPQLLPRRAGTQTPSLTRSLVRRAVFVVLMMLLTNAAYEAGVMLL